MPSAQDLKPRAISHLAVIMDGNGRWAKQRHLPRAMGHRAGVKALRTLLEACAKRDIAFVTVYAFSNENWQRPQQEVADLMALFADALDKETPDLIKQSMALRFAGDLSAFAPALQQQITQACQRTRDALAETAARLTLTVCMNYGGQDEIVRAIKKALHTYPEAAQPDWWSVQRFAAHTDFVDMPAPDLLIRSSGEQRISNFLLWHLAYTELYFSPVLWPDFDETELDKALQAFNQRDRRFGGRDER